MSGTAGGIVGGAGAWGGLSGPGYGQLAAFAASPAAGASAAAISGADPGMGAAIAAATAAFALGVQQAYEVYKQYSLTQGQTQMQSSDGSATQAVNSSKPILGKCLSDYCEGLQGYFTKTSGGPGGRLDFGIQKTFPVGRKPLDVDLYWHSTDSGVISWQSPVSQSHQLLQSFSLTTHSMQHVTVPYGEGYYKLFVRPWAITPSDHMGGGTYHVCVSACR